MERNRTRRRGTLRERGISRDLLRLWNQLKACGRQRRGMQHLANGTSCLRSLGVLVEKREACGDV